MLNTKDMSVGSGSIKPVIGVGNHKVKINSIHLTKHHMTQMHIMLCYM